jgi:hypothetical protein
MAGAGWDPRHARPVERGREIGSARGDRLVDEPGAPFVPAQVSLRTTVRF